MLSRILSIIKSSKSNEISSGTLFCNDYIIADKECLNFLYKEDCFEQTIFIEDLNDNETINIELSLHKLEAIGFYFNFDSFILKNKYEQPIGNFYIHELGCFDTDTNDELIKYKTIISLIDSVSNVSKHNFNDVEIQHLIIYREDKSIVLPLIYNSEDVKLIMLDNIEKIDLLTATLNESNTEKKLLFINELIEFLVTQDDVHRFQYLLLHFSDFFEKANNSYQFYLSDFSFNKLKIELDTKALEYTQKIQSVINDSQTKLIAIPTAFVLVFAAFDFTDLFAIKNIATIISLFIFAILIQLFLNNQKSTLNFIWENIESYKGNFKKNDIEKISSKFALVEKELKIQKNRLGIVEIILWLIPVALAYLWFFLINLQLISNIIGFTFILIVVILKILIK